MTALLYVVAILAAAAVIAVSVYVLIGALGWFVGWLWRGWK